MLLCVVLFRFRGHVKVNGSHTLVFWQIWAARLAFVLLFEVCVAQAVSISIHSSNYH